MANFSENVNITLIENGSGSQLNAIEIHQLAAPELLVVDKLITPIWYLIGIIGNPISTKIWLARKVRKNNTSAIYLGSIAIVHLVFIFLHIWVELLQAWDVRTYNRPYLCEVFLVLYILPQYLAPILILGFTVERYIAICHPFLKESFCTVKRAVRVILGLTFLAAILASLQAYVWTYNDTRLCDIRPGVKQFNIYWTWISEMLVFAVVPITVLIFNVLVIMVIRKIESSGPAFHHDGSSNQTSTITLLSVSFYLICTLLPATVVYAIQLSIPYGNVNLPPQLWSQDSSWTSYLTYYHIRKIIEELCFSNYACYVIIYYITSGYFRSEVRRMFRMDSCFSQRSKDNKGKPPLGYMVVNETGVTTLSTTKPDL